MSQGSITSCDESMLGREAFASLYAKGQLTTHSVAAQDGKVTFKDKTPEQHGIPAWRAQITYVPQSRVASKGTPSEFYFAAQVMPALAGPCRA